MTAPRRSTRSNAAFAVAAVGGFVVTVIGAGVLLVNQRDTQDALCRFAQRSADTKELFVDTFEAAFEVDQTNPYIAAMRDYIAVERAELVGFCDHPDTPPEEP